MSKNPNLQIVTKNVPFKGKAKTQSEDITEQNTFLSNRKESEKKTEEKLVQNESESNISTNVSKDAVISDSQTPPALNKKKRNPRCDYVELDMIGCGSFGRVVKVQKKSDGTQYAMKVIEKKKVEKVNICFIDDFIFLILPLSFDCCYSVLTPNVLL